VLEFDCARQALVVIDLVAVGNKLPGLDVIVLTRDEVAKALGPIFDDVADWTDLLISEDAFNFFN
jgi:hypothetical protein